MNTSFDAPSISSNENRVAETSLIRPKLLNRFDNQLQIELATALLEELAKDGVGSARSSWVDRAFSAGDGGCLVWPQAGKLRARRHLLTGDPLDAATAYRLGIVTASAATIRPVAPSGRPLVRVDASSELGHHRCQSATYR
jgi:enoyl-CoA hydratase/carnithine racemase